MDMPDDRVIETASALAALTEQVKSLHGIMLDERDQSRKRDAEAAHFRAEMLVRMDRMDQSLVDSRELWKEHISHGGHSNLQTAIDSLTQRIMLMETTVKSMERDLQGKVSSAGFAWLWRVIGGVIVVLSATYTAVKMIEMLGGR